MAPRKRPIPGIEPHRSFPYYKIQIWEEKRAVWIDVQKKFSTVEAVQAYARQNIERGRRARVMVVEGYGRRRIDETTDLFGEK